MPPSITGPSPAKAWTSKPMPVRGTSARGEPSLRRGRNRPAVVSLSSSASPSTVATCRPAARATVVSSVGAAPVQPRRRRSRSSRRKACGVWTRTRPRAVDRLAEQSPSPRASVSPTGSTGTAPSWTRARASSRSITVGRAEGAGGVVDQHARRRRSRARPSRTESGALGAADDQRRRRRARRARPRQARPGPRRSRPGPRRSAGCAASASTAQRSTGLPPIGAILLGHAAAEALPASGGDDQVR